MKTVTPKERAIQHASTMFATNPGRLYATVWCGGMEYLFERGENNAPKLKATRKQPDDSEGREFPSWGASN